MNNMSEYYKEHYFFYTGDVAKLLGVHRTTIWRWIQDKEIDALRRDTDSKYIVSLREINKKRKQNKLPELSKEDAMYFWMNGRLPEGK